MRIFLLFFALLASPAGLFSEENLIPNGDFESGAWGGNAWRGKGSVACATEGAHGGRACLLLTGLSGDAAVQAISGKIAVEASKTYTIAFHYKCSARATVDLRWKGGGIVYELRKPVDAWLGLDEALARKDAGGIRYLRGLGAAEGRESLGDSRVRFPEGVSEVAVYLTLSGEGTLRVDDVSLRALGADAADRYAGGNAMDRDEADRLLVRKATNVDAAAATPSRLKLDMRDVELPDAILRDTTAWPAVATNLRIRGDQFLRGERPAFLIGVESVVVYPWLYKLLGMDLIHLQDPCPTAVMRTRRTNDTVSVWWEPYQWMEAQLRQLLAAGLATYVQPYEERQDVFQNVPLSKEFPELFVNRSHFLNWRFEEPQGERLRENMWKSLLGITRRYPVFAYELFNEVRYMDYSPSNIASFRAAMQTKYRDLESANKAWGTVFRSFAEVAPPEKSSAAGGNLMGIKPAPQTLAPDSGDARLPGAFSRPLWIDWQKHIEQVFAGHMADTARLVRRIDPSPNAYRTIQSVCDLHQDYSGGGGVYPPLKLKAEDFFGDEASGGTYISQEGGDDFHEIKRMIKPLLFYDLVSFLSAGKPILDIECMVQGYGRSPAPGSRVVELHGPWKFSPDNEQRGLGKHLEAPAFDDASWKEITVPGLWGPQGFKDCSFAWYRKRFNLPASLAGKRLYLNASKLADQATVWVNGVEVARTQAWNETLAVDVSAQARPGGENVIAVCILNKYFDSGMFWGGMRDYISLDVRPYPPYVPLTAGQMRSFLWEKALHGKNGVIMSYAYDPEATRLSMFNPRKVSFEALRAIPAARLEIERVADLVLPEHRKPSPVALMFSFESGRGRVCKGFEEWIAAPASKDMLDWYAALCFGQVPVDVVHNDGLLAGACDSHRALLFRMCERVKPGTLEKLRAFAEKGGIVVIDHGSLAIDDERHTPLDLEALAGIQVGAAFTNVRRVEAGEPGGQGFETRPRQFDGHSGRAVRPTKAKALLRYADGSPAATALSVGKGWVYYLAAEWPEDGFQGFLTALLARHGIVNENLVLTRQAGETRGRHTEARFLSRGAESLVYLHNWGDGPARLLLRLPKMPEGSYRIRDVRDGSRFGGEAQPAAGLRAGIPLTLSGQDPLVLLIEPSAEPARAFAALPKDHEDKLALLRPSPKAATRVLVNASHAETITKVRMLTAVRLLEADGFELQTGLEEVKENVTVSGEGIRSEKLASFQIFTTLGNATGDRRFKKEEIEALRQFVTNGGSLLLAANFFAGPHYWMENWGAKGPLAKAFGVELTHQNISDPGTGLDGFAFHPRVEGVSGHPITTGVSVVQSLGMSTLKIGKVDATVLLKSGANANPAQAPVAIAFEYGKGRVVMLGDAKWMQPELLAQGDNAQFCLNLFRWLARRENTIAVMKANEKARAVEAGLE